MTAPPTRPGSAAPAGDVEPPEEKAPAAPARLSLVQMLAGALAAVSTTVLLSYFGTAGTIIGAATASVATVLANHVYTRSLEKTREQLKPVVGKVVAPVQRPRGQGTTAVLPRVPRGTGTTAATAATTVGRSTGAEPTHRGDDADTEVLEATSVTRVLDGAVTVDATAAGAGDPDGADGRAGDGTDAAPQGRWSRLLERHGHRKVLAVAAVALFVVVMAVVLVVELVIGKPLSDAVRGVEGSGTTLSRTQGDLSGTTTPAPSGTDEPVEQPVDPSTTEPGTAPGQAPTETPSEPATEPTTEPDDATPEPTTPGTDPTPEPTEEPTDEPTEDPGTVPDDEPSADPTGAPTSEPTPAPGDDTTAPSSGATAEPTQPSGGATAGPTPDAGGAPAPPAPQPSVS